MTITRRLGQISLIALTGLMLTACASETHRRDSQGNIVLTARGLDPAGTRYSDTLDIANSGDCSEETITFLTCYAHRGHGYEGAQTALGQCNIHNNKVSEGVEWLKRAADAGWPDAQKILSQMYLDGKEVPNDNIQAGKWAALYSRNPSLLSLGVMPERKLMETVNATLSSGERLAADGEASKWIPRYWEPSAPLDQKLAAVCYVAPRRTIVKPTLDLNNETIEY